MAVYAIGDVQGCYDSLIKLLDKINFDRASDKLWFVGDIINRGPKSLETLRYIKNLGERAITVLGNHDLNLLAVAYGFRPLKPRDTLKSVLTAPDRDDLLHWLRHRPLLHHDNTLNFTMVHAGLPPQWDLQQAMRLAAEIESQLQGDHFLSLLENMYGDKPNIWNEQLTGSDRSRFITNCFTRIRYCTDRGELDMESKGPPGTQAQEYKPWFDIKNRKSANLKIVFGHWSALTLTEHSSPTVFPIDTGCVWGMMLTALQLDHKNHPIVQVDAQEQTGSNI